jgi:hypothetical protein
MPSPRLQALYSTQLLDGDKNTKNNNNECLDYLQEHRGLKVATLRKYGVGRAEYSFPNHDSSSSSSSTGEWTKAECVTFPWIMSVSQIEYQEELRGAKFVWEQPPSSIKEEKVDDDARKSRAEERKAKAEERKARAAARKAKKNGKKEDADAATTKAEKDEKAAAPTTDADKVRTPTLKEIKDSTYLTRRIKVRAVDNKAWQRMDPPGGGWGLFGFHTVPADAKEIILTEGEYDAMAVWQATGRPTVSLPNGCRSLPVEVLPLLEDFEKVYLWMDNDAAGQEGAALFSKKIGLERCYIVRPTLANCEVEIADDLPKDANEALLCGFDLENIIADAKLTPHERIVDFAELRNDVLHEIMYPDKYVGVPISSLPGLTNIMKGLRRGEMTVLTGPTGSGEYTNIEFHLYVL